MKILLALIVVLAATAPRPAAADPINITAGFLDMSPASGPLSLSGDRGFTFSSFVSASAGIFLPWANCNGDPLQCGPGDSLNLRGFWIDNDVTGTATLDGNTYTRVGAAGSSSSMTVQFSGTAVLPPLRAGSITITAPFLFNGSFFHPVDNNASGFPAITEPLAGSGTATLTIAPAGLGDSWFVNHARYDFVDSQAPSPTPEPATLLLLGSGLLGLGAIVSRSRRGRRAI